MAIPCVWAILWNNASEWNKVDFEAQIQMDKFSHDPRFNHCCCSTILFSSVAVHSFKYKNCIIEHCWYVKLIIIFIDFLIERKFTVGDIHFW